VLLILSPLIGVGATWAWHAGDFSTLRPTSLVGSPPVGDDYAVTFSMCSGLVRRNCIVDGDTLWLDGEKIRIADINAPEVSKPNCANEARLGGEATQGLLHLMNAGRFSLQTVDRDVDRYGRKLRIVTRQGESIGAVLVNQGLAERWNGRRAGWC
jgi:endonuclease YncB( thermonuclease family)